jgi:hypothetical protein
VVVIIAACVLLTEYRDGYPNRLLAIGPLFEAEDESQAWPELHDAIRDARRTYQQTGKMPDFNALAAIISKFRCHIRRFELVWFGLR